MIAALVLAATLTTAPEPCPGAPDFPMTGANAKVWEFTEAPGSTVFRELLRGAPADDLKVVPGYTTPTASGAAVHFDNDGLLATDGTVFSPDGRDFAVCAKWEVAANDLDGYNVWQIGNRHAYPSKYGVLKLLSYYETAQSTTGRVRMNAGGGSARGTGYHTYTLTRVGDTFCAFNDGVKKTCKTMTGPIPLSYRMTVGGKLEAEHTHGSDLLRGGVASVKVATR